MFSLTANDERIGASDDTPMLWVLWNVLNLNGTKFACGSRSADPCVFSHRQPQFNGALP
jgi:aerobic-type carbon monoxide dehydrogenase small subunit (CoxS/CutS family)